MKERINPERFRERIHQFLLINFIASGVLLFGSDSLIQQLRLKGIVEQYGSLISLIYLITLCYFLVLAANLVWQFLDRKIQYQRAERLAEIKAACLDNEERALLREFFLQRTRTLILPIQQEAVQSLLKNHILENVEEINLEAPNQRFAISAAARRFITSNNLRLPVDELTEEDIRYFKASRPSYIKEQLKLQWREQLKAQRRQAA